MNLELENRLKGTRGRAVLAELASNSLHFPIALLFMEWLRSGMFAIVVNPLTFLLLVSTAVQAYFLGSRYYKQKRDYLLGNLITPIIFTTAGLLIQGMSFVRSPVILIYWAVALLIGVLNEFYIYRTDTAGEIANFIKNFFRIQIFSVVYIFYVGDNQSILMFTRNLLNSSQHLLVLFMVMMFGLIIGAITALSDIRLSLLRQTSSLVKKYSTWIFGTGLLSMPDMAANTLSKEKTERTLVLVGITGFTDWAEAHSSEVVVSLLNDYFQETERIWKQAGAIKARHTSDEILAIFEDSLEAVQAAYSVMASVEGDLKPFNLSVRIGIHNGPLTEGLIGSDEIKIYDVVGKTVSITRNIFENALEGELLISDSVFIKTAEYVGVENSREISISQNETLSVFPLKSLSLLL